MDASGQPQLDAGQADSFGFGLDYETAGQYDGNIGKQRWLGVRQPTVTRQYSYQYDGAKRVTGATYAGAGGENYTLSGMSYDRNGNILSLNRAGIDQLTYTYAQGNSLTAVSDASGNTAGFADGNTSGADYTYWPEGSIKKDLNRGISDVQYNLLKLPSQVSFTSGKIVRYQYDAGGSKLKMSVVNGEVRDYVGAFQYLTPGGGSRSLFEISTEEGRYTPVSGYEYYHRDHLGNVRAVQGQSGVSQWTDYDPWGLELSGLSSGSSTSRARFNGQEAIAEIGAGYLDFGARGYDATIGRWGVVDPLAEVSRRWSPFVFGYNNPLRFVDPDGMNGVDTQKTSQDVQYTDGYGSYSLAGSSASLQLSGTYQSNGGGGEQQGGTEQGGPGPKPKGSTPSPATNERNYANFQEQTKNLGPELMQTLGAIWNFAMGIPEQSDPNIQNATVPMPFFMGGGASRSAKIVALIEANAGRQLTAMEAATQGAHFVSRHGAGTTLAQQEVRALTGLTPDNVQRSAADASRFLSNQLQLQAVQRAQTIFGQTGRNVVNFNMGGVVGEGYLRGGSSVIQSSNVRAIFRSGNIITIFPVVR